MEALPPTHQAGGGEQVWVPAAPPRVADAFLATRPPGSLTRLSGEVCPHAPESTRSLGLGIRDQGPVLQVTHYLISQETPRLQICSPKRPQAVCDPHAL